MVTRFLWASKNNSDHHSQSVACLALLALSKSNNSLTDENPEAILIQYLSEHVKKLTRSHIKSVAMSSIIASRQEDLEQFTARNLKAIYEGNQEFE